MTDKEQRLARIITLAETWASMRSAFEPGDLDILLELDRLTNVVTSLEAIARKRWRPWVAVRAREALLEYSHVMVPEARERLTALIKETNGAA